MLAVVVGRLIRSRPASSHFVLPVSVARLPPAPLCETPLPSRALRLDAETAVCRLRSPQRASATPGRPPFLVAVPGEKDEAGVRQPNEKKGGTRFKHFWS